MIVNLELMVAFWIYLLKSSFCLTLLYGFYKLFFASTTRFSLNRWVLVGGMLTCLLLPFVSLELKHELSGVHEYQADEGVLDQGIDAKIYQLLLVRKAVGSRLYSMACGFTHSSLKKRISMMSKKRNTKWVRLRVLLAVPLAAGVVYAFAKPEVKETVADYSAVLQTKNQGKAKSGLVVRDADQRRDTDNLMLDHISSEKAYVLELYCNQRNHFLFGPENPVSKKELVDWETMTDKVRKQLTDAFAELYSKQKKEMFPIVVRIVADRNAKMGAITTAKQKLMKAYADVPAGVADKSVPLPEYGIQFWVDNRLAGELKDFSLDELSSKIMQLREENKAENFAVSLKIPSDASEGVVYDIKQVLRKGYMLKLNLTNDF